MGRWSRRSDGRVKRNRQFCPSRALPYKSRKPADTRPVLRQLRPAQVLVFGHSFVRRLNKRLIKNKGAYHNLGLNFEFAEVHWLGIGGLNIKDARAEQLIVVEHLRPDVVYVELGTVDLSDIEMGPEEVASHLHELALDMMALGVKRVIIGQILFRDGRGIPNDTPYFNQRVLLANQILEAILHPVNTMGTRFWKHKGLWQSEYPTLVKDGVHLNRLGEGRLYRSIRGAVIQEVYSIQELFDHYYL